MFIATNTVTKIIPVPAATNFVEVLVWTRQENDTGTHVNLCWVSHKTIVNLAFAQEMNPYTLDDTSTAWIASKSGDGLSGHTKNNGTLIAPFKNAKKLDSREGYIVSFVEGCPTKRMFISFIEEKPAKPKAVKTKKSNV